MAKENVVSGKDAKNCTFFCDLCKLEYVTEQDLEEHTWSLLHHKRLDKEKGRDYVHECSLCNEQIFGLLAFTKHIHSDVHHKKLQERRTKNLPPQLDSPDLNAEIIYDHNRDSTAKDGDPAFSDQNTEPNLKSNHNHYSTYKNWIRPGYQPRYSLPRFRHLRPPPQNTWRPPTFNRFNQPRPPRFQFPFSQQNPIYFPQRPRFYHSPNDANSTNEFPVARHYPNSESGSQIHIPVGFQDESYDELERFQGFKAVSTMKERMKGLSDYKSRKFHLSGTLDKRKLELENPAHPNKNNDSTDIPCKRPRRSENETLTSANVMKKSATSSTDARHSSIKATDGSGSFTIVSRTTENCANLSKSKDVARINIPHDTAVTTTRSVNTVQRTDSINKRPCPFVSDDEEQSLATFVTENLFAPKDIIAADKVTSSIADSTKNGHETENESGSKHSKNGQKYRDSLKKNPRVTIPVTTLIARTESCVLVTAVSGNFAQTLTTSINKTSASRKDSVKQNSHHQVNVTSPQTVVFSSSVPISSVLPRAPLFTAPITSSSTENDSRYSKQIGAKQKELSNPPNHKPDDRSSVDFSKSSRCRNSGTVEPDDVSRLLWGSRPLNTASSSSCTNQANERRNEQRREVIEISSDQSASVSPVIGATSADNNSTAVASLSPSVSTSLVRQAPPKAEKANEKTVSLVKGESIEGQSSFEKSLLSFDESLESISDSNQCEFLYKDGRRCPSHTEKKFCTYHQKVLQAVHTHITKSAAPTAVQSDTESPGVFRPPSTASIDLLSKTPLAYNVSTPNASHLAVSLSANVATTLSGARPTIPSSVASDHQFANLSVTLGRKTQLPSLKPVEALQTNDSATSESVQPPENSSTGSLTLSRFRYLNKTTSNPTIDLHIARNNLPLVVRKILNKKFGSSLRNRTSSESETDASQDPKDAEDRNDNGVIDAGTQQRHVASGQLVHGSQPHPRTSSQDSVSGRVGRDSGFPAYKDALTLLQSQRIASAKGKESANKCPTTAVVCSARESQPAAKDKAIINTSKAVPICIANTVVRKSASSHSDGNRAMERETTGTYLNGASLKNRLAASTSCANKIVATESGSTVSRANCKSFEVLGSSVNSVSSSTSQDSRFVRGSATEKGITVNRVDSSSLLGKRFAYADYSAGNSSTATTLSSNVRTDLEDRMDSRKDLTNPQQLESTVNIDSIMNGSEKPVNATAHHIDDMQQESVNSVTAGSKMKRQKQVLREFFDNLTKARNDPKPTNSPLKIPSTRRNSTSQGETEKTKDDNETMNQEKRRKTAAITSSKQSRMNNDGQSESSASTKTKQVKESDTTAKKKTKEVKESDTTAMKEINGLKEVKESDTTSTKKTKEVKEVKESDTSAKKKKKGPKAVEESDTTSTKKTKEVKEVKESDATAKKKKKGPNAVEESDTTSTKKTKEVKEVKESDATAKKKKKGPNAIEESDTTSTKKTKEVKEVKEIKESDTTATKKKKEVQEVKSKKKLKHKKMHNDPTEASGKSKKACDSPSCQKDVRLLLQMEFKAKKKSKALSKVRSRMKEIREQIELLNAELGKLSRTENLKLIEIETNTRYKEKLSKTLFDEYGDSVTALIQQEREEQNLQLDPETGNNESNTGNSSHDRLEAKEGEVASPGSNQKKDVGRKKQKKSKKEVDDDVSLGSKSAKKRSGSSSSTCSAVPVLHHLESNSSSISTPARDKNSPTSATDYLTSLKPRDCINKDSEVCTDIPGRAKGFGVTNDINSNPTMEINHGESLRTVVGCRESDSPRLPVDNQSIISEANTQCSTTEVSSRINSMYDVRDVDASSSTSEALPLTSFERSESDVTISYTSMPSGATSADRLTTDDDSLGSHVINRDRIRNAWLERNESPGSSCSSSAYEKHRTKSSVDFRKSLRGHSPLDPCRLEFGNEEESDPPRALHGDECRSSSVLHCGLTTLQEPNKQGNAGEKRQKTEGFSPSDTALTPCTSRAPRIAVEKLRCYEAFQRSLNMCGESDESIACAKESSNSSKKRKRTTDEALEPNDLPATESPTARKKAKPESRNKDGAKKSSDSRSSDRLTKSSCKRPKTKKDGEIATPETTASPQSMCSVDEGKLQNKQKKSKKKVEKSRSKSKETKEKTVNSKGKSPHLNNSTPSSGLGSQLTNENSETPNQKEKGTLQKSDQSWQKDKIFESSILESREDYLKRIFAYYKTGATAIQIHKGFIYTASLDRKIRVHFFKQNNVFTQGAISCKKQITCLEISRSEKKPRLFVGLDDKRVECFDINNLKSMHNFIFNGLVTALHSAYGNLYVGLDNGYFSAISLKANKSIGTFLCHPAYGKSINCITSAIFRSKGVLQRLIIIGVSKMDITVHNPIDGSLIVNLTENTLSAVCMEVSDQWLYSGSEDGRVLLYNLETLKPSGFFCCLDSGITAIKAVGKVVFIASRSTLIRCYNMENKQLLRVYGGHQDVICMALDGLDTIYTVGKDGLIKTVKVNVDKITKCEWEHCGLPFAVLSQLKLHIIDDHFTSKGKEVYCKWKSYRSSDNYCSFHSPSMERVIAHVEQHLACTLP